MNSSFRSRRPAWRFLARAAAVIATPLLLSHCAGTYLLSIKCWDLYQRAAPYRHREPSVQVVDIDDSSLARIGRWPWPLPVVADLLGRLSDAGAAEIGFDLVLAGHPPGQAPSREVTIDPRLADAFGRVPVVIGFVMTAGASNGGVLKKAAIGFEGPVDANPFQELYDFPAAIVSLSQLQDKAAGLGFINVTSDFEHRMLRVPLLAELDGRPVASLAAEIVRVARGASSYHGFAPGGALRGVLIGGLPVPTDKLGEVWVHYGPSRPAGFIHAADVLAGNFDRARIAGRIVMIGASAASLGDQWPSPLGTMMPGVEIQAQLVEQILGREVLTRPAWLRGAEIIWAYAAALALLVAARFGWAALIAGAALLLAGTVGASWLAFADWHELADPVPAALTILAIASVEAALRHPSRR